MNRKGMDGYINKLVRQVSRRRKLMETTTAQSNKQRHSKVSQGRDIAEKQVIKRSEESKQFTASKHW